MTEKQAYCCLNCTNLPPCNPAAGNCVSCCADCGDTNSCITTAYFGKDDQIYKGYVATYFAWGTQYNWLVDQEFQSASWNGTYNSLTNEKLVFGFSTFNSWNGQDECGGGPEEFYNNRTDTYSGKTATGTTSVRGACSDCFDCEDPDLCSYPNSKYLFQCGCTCNKVFNDTFPLDLPFFPIVDASAPSCGMFKDATHDSGGTVTFIIPLKTYNSLGEIVANPSPISPYNPCQPIRHAYAGGCYFFAP